MITRLNIKKYNFFIFFTAFFLPMLILFCICYPGLYTYDTFSGLNEIFHNRHHTWLSPLYSLFLELNLSILFHPAIFSLTQIFFSSITLAFIFSYLLSAQKYRSLFYCLAITLALNPLFLLQNLIISRDYWQAWIQAFLFFEFYKLFCTKFYFRNNEKNKQWSLKILIFITIYIFIRKENILVTPLLIGALIWRSKNIKYNLFFFVTIFTFSSLIITKKSNISFKILFFGTPRYQLTALINPLSYILVKTGTSQLDEKQLSIIEKVIPIDRLLSKQNDYGVNPISRTHLSFSDQDFFAFRSLSFRIFIRNPMLFIENRVKIFTAIIGVKGPTSIVQNLFFKSINTKALFVKNIFYDYGVQLKKPKYSTLGEKIIYNIKSKKHGLYLLSNTALPSLIVCFFCLFLFRVTPISSALSAITLLKTSVVFFLAPAAQFNYVYPCYLTGYFLVGFVWHELSIKKNHNST